MISKIMVFFGVFFKTLGFLLGLTVFLIILNTLLFFLSQNNENFKFIKGEVQSDNIIAILNLNGPIINNFNKTLVGNVIEYIDPQVVKNYLSDLKNINPKILIININSPGGTVNASASLEKIIQKFKIQNDIEIYFYSNEILASGGYWVATSADKIFANYGSIIGSIGVSGPSWYYYNKPTTISKGLLGQTIETKNGIEVFNQNAGTSKDLYNPFRKPTEIELEHLKNMVTEIYNDFVIKVSKSRKIEIKTLKEDIAALVYTGHQAKEKHLIDDVLEFDELIIKLTKEKNFNDYKLIEIQTKENLFNRYFKAFFTVDNSGICDILNSNFISLQPIFLKKC